MRIQPFLVLSLLILIPSFLTGCSEESPPAPTSSSSSAHAPAAAEPGSHADWCGEHGVAESMCTRCNPDLVPAFQATGDWCEEHRLPESQCKACNPDLEIERPPAEES
jgi:hypothetical protein